MATSRLRAGDEIELTIDKAAAGGRMIARHEGQVVLVAGAVPGERVRARIEKADKRLAFAATTSVVEASPDRRAGFADPNCGGCVYSHVAYPRQLLLKTDIVRDAFARIGHLPVDGPLPISGSPESGYRMRARLHADRGRVGFFREGTHTLCDPAATSQLTPESLESARTAVEEIARAGARATAVELIENIAATERALAIAVDDAEPITRGVLSRLTDAARIGGCVVLDLKGARVAAGELTVGDAIAALSMDRASGGELRRHPESFFQANRFLVPKLVARVVDEAGPGERILDLYAGVGLFAVTLAAAGRRGITAVEGDRSSGGDLCRNAGPFGAAVTLALESVESWLASLDRRARPDTVIVDPPRTGMSSEASTALIGLHAPRLVYVSCDAPTLARDARKLVDAGYRLTRLEAFDLFPNTPHVECVAVFER